MTTQLMFSDLYQQQKVAAPRRRVCDLPAEERPLYRLHQAGSRGLATSELLALVLGSGDGPGLAAELLATFGSLHQLARASQAQLMSVNGIGAAQAARLLALLELSCRLQEPPAVERPRITNPAEGAALLTPRLAHLSQEVLCVVLLDTRNRVLQVVELYKGIIAVLIYILLYDSILYYGKEIGKDRRSFSPVGRDSANSAKVGKNR